jgi:pimeloyl-ACP methyl ester carboxylesterase
MAAHSHCWDAVAPVLATVDRVIALDQRGQGDSDWPEPAAYSIDHHTAGHCGFIDALRLNRPILIGHSMGGLNSLAYNGCIPVDVDRLILVDFRMSPNTATACSVLGQLLQLPAEASELDEVVSVSRNSCTRISLVLCRQIVRHGYHSSCQGTWVTKYDRQISVQMKRSGDVFEDLWPTKLKLKCPTLIMRCKDSPFVSRVELVRMKAALARAQWIEI